MIQYKNPNVTVFQSALFRTTSTVVQTRDMVLLVDPNWLPGEVEAIRHFVENEAAGRPVYLLFTHSDYDHIIGYGAFPQAKVIASEAFRQNPEKEKIIEQIRTWDDENYIARPYLIRYPGVDLAVSSDGQSFAVGNTKLTFYLAPGHNADGIFTLVEADERGFGSTWLAGDYLCEVEFPYIYHSSLEYEQTLDKVDFILEKHNPALLVPGHGDVATSHEEILIRKNEALEYIREMRRCIAEGTPFNMEKLWRRYRFRRGMERFHKENIELFKRECAGRQT
jgi:hydroxyacylglutathione hydrolase